MISGALFSSATDEWETPKDLFDKLDAEFHFTLDPAATPENAKCERFYTKADNGLQKSWGGVVWLNPPYGRTIGLWVRKAWESSLEGATVVMLIPAQTDTKWFHDYVYGKAEIRFIKGRVKFGNSKNGAPFPSMVVIFRGKGQ